MRNIINYNHIYGSASLQKISNESSFFVSSIHIKKDKMKKILDDKEPKVKFYIDFMHYLSTDFYSNWLSENVKNKIDEKMYDDIFIKENLILLKLKNEDDKIKKLINRSISSWKQVILNSSDFYFYALPFPIISSLDKYEEIIDMYINEYKNIKLESKQLFFHLVIKSNTNVNNNTLEKIYSFLREMNINEIIISFWRDGDSLLTNKEDLENIRTISNFFTDKKLSVWLNYLHNEFYYFSLKNKNIKFVIGTFEQTKVLSPETLIFSDDMNEQKRMVDKIFDDKLLVNIKKNYVNSLNDISDNSLKLISSDRVEIFKENTKTISKYIEKLPIEVIDEAQKILNYIVNDQFLFKMYNSALKYKITDYIKLNNILLERK